MGLQSLGDVQASQTWNMRRQNVMDYAQGSSCFDNYAIRLPHQQQWMPASAPRKSVFLSKGDAGEKLRSVKHPTCGTTWHSGCDEPGSRKRTHRRAPWSSSFQHQFQLLQLVSDACLCKSNTHLLSKILQVVLEIPEGYVFHHHALEVGLFT